MALLIRFLDIMVVIYLFRFILLILMKSFAGLIIRDQWVCRSLKCDWATVLVYIYSIMATCLAWFSSLLRIIRRMLVYILTSMRINGIMISKISAGDSILNSILHKINILLLLLNSLLHEWSRITRWLLSLSSLLCASA